MFEFEDNVSTGFHDVFLSKYTESSCPILDFYISDSMQDMLDIDIRSEVATVVGGVSEFTSLMNDLPSLDLDTSSSDGDVAWLGGPKWSCTSTSNDIYADVGACVNPNSVMPVINVTTTGSSTLTSSTTVSTSLLTSPKSQLNLNTNTFHASNPPMPSPKEKKSHLTFSPNTIKVPVVQETKKQSLLCQAQRASVENIKKDLNDEMMKNEKTFKPFKQAIGGPATNTIKLGPGIGGLTFANSIAYAKLKNQNGNGTKLTANGNIITTIKQQNQQRASSPLNANISTGTNSGGNNSLLNSNNGQTQMVNGQMQQPKIFSRSIVVQSKGTMVSANGQPSPTFQASGMTTVQHANVNGAFHKQPIKVKVTGQEFPKPAYSYSCLIAMALKNSRAGSLPVSEIYSFMCEHFPYFKTAPNGWKNSVRHNLSLNKCFEKIEKPATNGGQRKGCLWAMNPSKIAKMDEEVLKWSRKDPMAIRKAMVFPDNLEALERGEMKHGSLNDDEGENEGNTDTEENSDSEIDNDMEDTLIGSNSFVPDADSCDDDEAHSQTDFDVEVTEMYDEIDIEESKPILPHINQIKFVDRDSLSPASKRARIDMNYSISPAGGFNGTTQLQMQKQPIQQVHTQQQLLQQQQNRRKMTLVNRIA